VSLAARTLDFAKDVLQTAFRLFPWPTEPGLRCIGQPDRSSPVLLTGNFDLTVRRLCRVLQGHDAWLIVAPSGGVNVWCASAGGHLTTHQVVTAVKTSGIEDRVDHRRLILPQLAATGVQALEVFRRTRWNSRFGPVHMQDLPRFLASGEKTDAMRRVRFPLVDRLQMAVVWAVPTFLVLAGVALWLNPNWTIPLGLLIATMSVALFTLYDRLGTARRLIFLASSIAISLLATALAGGSIPALVTAAVVAAFLTALLTFDYSGSTPLEGGSHFEERKWSIVLDADRCEGVFRCLEVCPEACFEKLDGVRKVELAHDERCIRCGACVVQCPEDALYFEDEAGIRIEPEMIRRYKLNLLGERSVG